MALNGEDLYILSFELNRLFTKARILRIQETAHSIIFAWHQHEISSYQQKDLY